MWTVPEPSNSEIQEMAKNLGCTWIGSVRVQSEVFATPLCCHANVKKQVELIGGEPVLGYYFMSYQNGEDYQAISHSVWRDLSGELIDITPFDDDRIANTFAVSSGVHPQLRSAFFQSLDKYLFQETEIMFYVYLLIDPRNRRPFYVGKGTGKRAQTHLWQISREHNPYKDNVIADIRRDGFEPEIVYAVEDIVDEKLAYDIETKLIQLWGRKGYDDNGILTNACLDNRPPNHKGRTYEEIYGPERAREQREMRRQLQLARGGYGPKKHSEETLAKMRIANAGERNGHYGKTLSVEHRRQLSEKARLRKGSKSKLSQIYRLTSPSGDEHVFHGWAEVIQFCKANDLSYGTFHSNLQKGWPPSKRGKNAGWTITQTKPQKDNT